MSSSSSNSCSGEDSDSDYQSSSGSGSDDEDNQKFIGSITSRERRSTRSALNGGHWNDSHVNDGMEDTANNNDANEDSTGDEVEVIDNGSNQGVVIESRSSSATRSIRRPDEIIRVVVPRSSDGPLPQSPSRATSAAVDTAPSTPAPASLNVNESKTPSQQSPLKKKMDRKNSIPIGGSGSSDVAANAALAAFAGVNTQVVVDMSVDSDVEMEIETIMSSGILSSSNKPLPQSKSRSTAKSSRKKKRKQSPSKSTAQLKSNHIKAYTSSDITESPKMFGDIVIGIEKRLCEECFRKCGHKVSDHAKSSHLYAFHFDHMLKYWKKVEECSSLRRDIAAMLLESIKCRLACAFCHEFGNVSGYEDKIKQVSQLRYDFGNQHRTAAEGLGIMEMALFVPECKSRGVFWTGKDAKVSWRTLEVLVWRYFKIALSDLTYWTSEDWVMKGATKGKEMKRGRMIPNTIIVNLLKKLGVKCPGCLEDFVNKSPAMMSGVHMDHRGKKRKGISDCIPLYIDILVEELKRGECVPTCAFCHGEITAWEGGRETKPIWM